MINTYPTRRHLSYPVVSSSNWCNENDKTVGAHLLAEVQAPKTA